MLSDFRLISDDGEYKIAVVVVTTFPWRRFFMPERVVREVAKKRLSSYWFFTDTGGWTPGYECERLAMAYEARTHTDEARKLVEDRKKEFKGYVAGAKNDA